jgi:hypothetical protein
VLESDNDDLAMTGVGNKSLLICPAERAATRFLAQSRPYVCLHVFAKPLVVRWIECQAAAGAKHVRILASDRAEQVRSLVGDGSRWGLEIEVVSEPIELTPTEARAKYCANAAEWLPQPNDVTLMDHFPGLPDYPVFKSYAHWFNGLRALLTHVVSEKNDVREIKPGVWVSARARISQNAELRAPCWIGPHTVVGAETIIGPMAVLEDRVMVESAVEISNSSVAPETLVGKMTEVKDSIADGDILLNWRSASCARVPDAFLLCSLAKRPPAGKTSNIFTRACSLVLLAASLPLALLGMAWAILCRRPPLRPLVAVRPFVSAEPGAMATVVYYEIGAGPAWLRAWPQLWSIASGDFAWVGNRPLSPSQVADLSTDFERLWLAAPIGLISLAHAQGAVDASDARPWSSLYASQANWRLDLSIIARAAMVTTIRSLTALF